MLTTKQVLDGYIIFYAQAAASTDSDNTCPFSYGVDAGADMYAQLDAPTLFGWGGSQSITLGGLRRVPIVPLQCPGGSKSKRSLAAIEPGYSHPENSSSYYTDPEDRNSFVEIDEPGSMEHLQYLYESKLGKRDTFSIGPIITIPAGFLSCPDDNGEANQGGCTVCQSDNDASADGDYNEKRKRDDGDDDDDDDSVPEQACPWCGPPSDESCTDDGNLAKRANAAKELSLPWTTVKANGDRTDYFSDYPQCGPNGAGAVNKVHSTDWLLSIMY